jgi:hypothetical protein
MIMNEGTAMNKFRKTLLVAIGVAAASSFQAKAAIGDMLFAEGGDISIRFEGSDAVYDSVVSVNGSSQFFPNQTTPVGTSFALGAFDAGTSIDIVLHVLTTGDSFHTGPGSLNADGLSHALITVGTDGRAYVGFEDLLGGGDADFNDHTFSLSNVTVTAVPEPSALALGTIGLCAFGFLARRRRPQG